jgi:uncharacterized protein (UPF0332 family)
MNLDDLLKKNKIKKITSNNKEIEELLLLADRDIKMSEFIVTQDWDWAFNIAYNSILQSSRAYMFKNGYRPSSNQGHKNTFDFLKIALQEHSILIGYFDRMRVKRNKALYETAGIISEKEVTEIIKNAKQFLNIIKKEINKN